MTSAQPLRGIRVLDFTWIGAGALVTKALAELGADVIRVESRARPDNLRLAPPFAPGSEELEGSGYFASRNPGKKSIALNMKHPASRDIALRLAQQSDVFTSNFRPGVLERWGLGYADVSEARPEIVYLVMPMQGLDGPHASHVGFGSTIAALAGLVHPSGLPGRAPIGTGTHYPDHVPNPGHALVALLAAIYHQRRTGHGQLVELSQLESTVNVMGPSILQGSLGCAPEPHGNHVDGKVPRGAYRCGDDRWLVVSCSTEAQWQALAKVLDHPEWATDPRFGTVAARSSNRNELDELLRESFAAWSRDGAVEALDGAGIPSAPVSDSREVLADARLGQRDFWHDVDHPAIGRMPMFRVPFRFAGQERPPMTPPPLLGEHTRQVASELLGLSATEYEALVQEGVFY